MIARKIMYTISIAITITLAHLPNTRISFSDKRLASESIGLNTQIITTDRKTATDSPVDEVVLLITVNPHTANPKRIVDVAKQIPGLER